MKALWVQRVDSNLVEGRGADTWIWSQVPNDIHLQGGLGLPTRDDERATVTDRGTAASQAREGEGRASVPEHSQNAAAGGADDQYSVVVLTGA